MAEQWGLPIIILGLIGLPQRSDDRLDRDFAAWWGAAVVLLVLAVVTPLDVRWVYALGPAAAVAAAGGVARCWSSGTPGRLAALLLLAIQGWLGAAAVWQALWERYR